MFAICLAIEGNLSAETPCWWLEGAMLHTTAAASIREKIPCWSEMWPPAKPEVHE